MLEPLTNRSETAGARRGDAAAAEVPAGGPCAANGPESRAAAENIIAAFEQLDVHDGGNETVVDVIDVVDSDDGDEEAASSALKLLHAKPSPRKRAKIGDDAIVHVDSQPPEPTTVAWWEYEECSQQMF